jgi:hypothetical protein
MAACRLTKAANFTHLIPGVAVAAMPTAPTHAVRKGVERLRVPCGRVRLCERSEPDERSGDLDLIPGEPEHSDDVLCRLTSYGITWWHMPYGNALYIHTKMSMPVI